MEAPLGLRINEQKIENSPFFFHVERERRRRTEILINRLTNLLNMKQKDVYIKRCPAVRSLAFWVFVSMCTHTLTRAQGIDLGRYESFYLRVCVCVCVFSRVCVLEELCVWEELVCVCVRERESVCV